MSHERHHDSKRRIGWALALAAAYMGAEIVAGVFANSLALLADAGHMALDVAALGLALWAMKLTERPATPERTYGYHRAEILAALANGAILVAISIYIFYEAYQRLREPQDVVGGAMLVVAVGGLIVNAVGMWLLQEHRHESLNVRGAWLHVVGDALGSIGVIVGAILVLLFGWMWADPVAGAVIGILILYGSWKLLAESVNVLMAASPSDIDSAEVRAAFEKVAGVADVHDLHVWTLTPRRPLLTAHVTIAPGADVAQTLDELGRICRNDFGVRHCTIQPEWKGNQECEPCE